MQAQPCQWMRWEERTGSGKTWGEDHGFVGFLKNYYFKHLLLTCCLFYAYAYKMCVCVCVCVERKNNIELRKVKHGRNKSKSRRRGKGGRRQRRKQERRAAGGHLCHQLQRVMEGEVKIKTRRRRLAPQPMPSLVSVACRWMCVCAGWVLGVGVGEWVNGWGISQRCRNAQVSRTLHISRVSSQCSRGTWAWGAPCASLLVRQIILMSHCVEQGVWIRRGETCLLGWQKSVRSKVVSHTRNGFGEEAAFIC